MRRTGILSRIALSACASSGGASSRPDETVRIVGEGSRNLTLPSNGDANVTRIASPIDRVWLAIRVQLKPDDGGGTMVETMFEAMAKPVSFSREYSRCTSRGVLETRLADAVKAQLRQ